MPGERRRCFRIDDRVGMDCRLLEGAELEAALEQFHSVTQRFGLLNRLRAERERHLPERRKLEAKFPAVAGYLALLEQQIDSLAEVLGDEGPAVLNQPSVEVNLSAQGLSFLGDRDYPAEARVQVRLVLFPERSRVQALARVVAAGGARAGSRVALEFTHLRPEDREAIAKHVHVAQLRRLQHLESGAED